MCDDTSPLLLQQIDPVPAWQKPPPDYPDRGTYYLTPHRVITTLFLASTSVRQYPLWHEFHSAASHPPPDNLLIQPCPNKKGTAQAFPNNSRVCSTSCPICSTNASTESNFSSSRNR